MNFTISPNEMKEFELQYFSGKFPHQRYGQAFCNRFNLTCPELFYEENTRTAKIMAWLNFVDCTNILEAKDE